MTRHLRARAALGAATLAGAALLVPAPAPAAPAAPAGPAALGNGPDIDVAAVEGHLQAFSDIAAAHDGNRAHGTSGYDASIDYVRGLLDGAGYTTTVQEFTSGGSTGYNLVADLPGGDESRTVVVGGHLDSVDEGAGINDNGSGSAGVLEVALRLAASGQTPTKHVRFGFWGAEELGLVGSSRYVAGLTPAEVAAIDSYYNVDMIGSPNPGYFLYDGDDSDGEGAGPGPDGSAELEQVLADYYAEIGVETRGTDFDGRSDYGPFIEAGVPAGGIFSGAEDSKSAEEVGLWGGDTGAYDPCYHSACDDLANIDTTALDRNSDALAHAVWTVAGVA